MSDYEDENDHWNQEDDGYDDNPPFDYTVDNNEYVVVETSMILKRKDDTQRIQFIIRFSDGDASQDAINTEYSQEIPRIESWIQQHYSGWKFFNIETVCVSNSKHSKHWNLDLSYDNED